LSSTSLTLGWLVTALLVWAISRTPLGRAVHDSRRQHLLFGTVFGLFALWLVRRDFDTGVSYHFIGMTAVTLLLDWPLAVLGGFLAQLGLLLLGRQDLAALGVNGLLIVCCRCWSPRCARSWSSAPSRATCSSISSAPAFSPPP
jgi:uncharacterized membrane protein